MKCGLTRGLVLNDILDLIDIPTQLCVALIFKCETALREMARMYRIVGLL